IPPFALIAKADVPCPGAVPAPGASIVMNGDCVWALALEPNSSAHRTNKNDTDAFPIFLLMMAILPLVFKFWGLRTGEFLDSHVGRSCGATLALRDSTAGVSGSSTPRGRQEFSGLIFSTPRHCS